MTWSSTMSHPTRRFNCHRLLSRSCSMSWSSTSWRLHAEDMDISGHVSLFHIGTACGLIRDTSRVEAANWGARRGMWLRSERVVDRWTRTALRVLAVRPGWAGRPDALHGWCVRRSALGKFAANYPLTRHHLTEARRASRPSVRPSAARAETSGDRRETALPSSGPYYLRPVSVTGQTRTRGHTRTRRASPLTRHTQITQAQHNTLLCSSPPTPVRPTH